MSTSGSAPKVPVPPTPPPPSLPELASKQFSDLKNHEAEKALVKSVLTGAVAYCGGVSTQEDEKDPASRYNHANKPPENPALWDQREIRSVLIRWLCTDHTAASLIDSRGIRICAARITGKLDLSYVTVGFPLSFDRCIFDEDADFSCCKVPALGFSGCHMKKVIVDSASIGGELSFDDGFVSHGGVTLLTTQISGNLECSGGTFHYRSDGPDACDHALWADRANITGSAFLGVFFDPYESDPQAGHSPNHGKSFQAKGTVRLVGAKIGSTLECSGGSFHVADPALQEPAFSLLCDRLTVGQVFLRKAAFRARGQYREVPFSAHGEVSFWVATVETNLLCSGGEFLRRVLNHDPNPDQPRGKNALSAHGAKITGDVFLDGTFSGDVDFLNSQISASLNCVRGTFTKLNLERASIKGSFCWSEIQGQNLELDLTNASTGPLEDHPNSWPASGHLRLDGFSYSRFSGPAPADKKSRLSWLSRAPFSLQPYQQLATVLKSGGDVDSPPDVLVEMEKKRRQAQNRPWLKKAGDWIFYCTIGYGEKPLWAFRWLFPMIIAGFVVYGLGYLGGAIIPSDTTTYGFFQTNKYPPANYSGFNPLIYSAENAFPLITLGVKSGWQPTSSGAFIEPVVHYKILRWMLDHHLTAPCPKLMRLVLWTQIIMGWALTALFSAGVTGLIKTT